MGKVYEYDAHINYWADDDGNDERVKEFFRESYTDGMNRYHARIAKIYAKENRERIEKEEKQKLAELKNKYES